MAKGWASISHLLKFTLQGKFQCIRKENKEKDDP